MVTNIGFAWAMPQHTDTSKNTKAAIKLNMCYMVLWGLYSALISALHNNIDPPEKEINPLRLHMAAHAAA